MRNKKKLKKIRDAKKARVMPSPFSDTPADKKPKAKKSDKTVTGKFIGNQRGFGFVVPLGENPDQPDVFIPPSHTHSALDGDTVICIITKEKKSDDTKVEGRITKITARQPMIGSFFTKAGLGFIKPVNTKIPFTFAVKPKNISRLGLADGHRVVFTLPIDMTHRGIETAIVTEIMGHINDPGMDVLTLIAQADVPHTFPQAVEEELTKIPDKVDGRSVRGRLDLREMFTFTIDGEDTKDIDDAISFEALADGNYHLGVHIADVSHYVTPGSAIDQAAFERGTSIYLADRVIPMLPHKLSSGICSLFPEVDRLTLSCLMTVDASGQVVDYKIAKTVINSKKRYTYDQIQGIIDAGGDTAEDQLIQQMNQLRHTLRNRRDTAGALDFNLPEAKITVDDLGRPIQITPYHRTNATAIIEEFMILCNETIAAHFLHLEVPFIFRSHQPPGEEKLAKLANATKHLGFTVPKNTSSPLALQKLLNKTASTAAAQAVATAVLHSLPQAKYTTEDPTHYGLASEAYSHFTSPIRRYGDLAAHRIIKLWLARDKKLLAKMEAILPEICHQASTTERTAETLEREVTQLKKVQFMEGQEGKTFKAAISGVAAWGAYAMLPNTVEGMIPAEHLKKLGYGFDKEKNVYVNKKGKVLRHGEGVTVKLVKSDQEERKILFGLV